MKRLTFFILLISTGMITSCATTPKVDNVVVTSEIKYVTPPDELLKGVDVPSPPKKEEYTAQLCENREVMLAKYIKDLLTVIKEYKLKDKQLIEWKSNVLKLQRNNK